MTGARHLTVTDFSETPPSIEAGGQQHLHEAVADALRNIEGLLPGSRCSLMLAADDVTRCPESNTLPATAQDGRGGERVSWTEPIRTAGGKVLGMIVVHTESGHPPGHEMQDKLRLAATLAARALEQDRPHGPYPDSWNFDPLTGLPNRALLDGRIRSAQQVAEHTNGVVALLLLDLDHFKDINDTLGHSFGDALLVHLLTRIQDIVHGDALVTRLGGDEFAVVMNAASRDEVELVARRILAAVAETHSVDGYDLSITGSLGIAVDPNDGTNFETLLRSADAAMYRAKAEGRHGLQFFTKELGHHASRHFLLFNAMRSASSRGELSVRYQPQLRMSDGLLIGAEALVRWHHPELGVIPPGEFIPLAEDCGLIVQIGEWVLRQALADALPWLAQAPETFSIAVNLSAVQFRCKELPERISQIVAEAGFPPHRLVLELTESAAMRDPESAVAMIARLNGCGIRVAIDDFGAGYSSLNYLKKFNSHKLKIDKSFIRDIGSDDDDLAIVRAIISMARQLNMSTLAEGVEQPEQLAILAAEGCDESQGYFISPALAAPEFAHFLRSFGQA